MSEVIFDVWIHICRYKVEKTELIKNLKEVIRANESALQKSLIDSDYFKIKRETQDLKKLLNFVEQKPQDKLFYNKMSKIVLSV